MSFFGLGWVGLLFAWFLFVGLLHAGGFFWIGGEKGGDVGKHGHEVPGRRLRRDDGVMGVVFGCWGGEV